MAEQNLTSFSFDNYLFCICNSNSILKFWNTSTCSLEQEFHPAESNSSTVTCIQFSPKIKEKSSKSQKKKKKSENSYETGYKIALGTSDGSVFIYNVDKQKVTYKFLPSSQSVKAVLWHSHYIIAVFTDEKLFVWDICKESLLWESNVVSGKSFCALGLSDYIIGDTNLQVLKYEPSTKEVTDVIFPAHATSVSHLVAITFDEEIDARYFLTAAESDRFVYAWSMENIEKNKHEPLVSFIVKDMIRSISCVATGSSELCVAIATKKGFLRIYNHYLNGTKNLKPIPFDGTLTIHSELKNLTLPVFSSNFVSNTELLIAYGTTLFPQCEKVAISSLTDKVTWSRKDLSVFTDASKSSLAKTETPTISKETVHLTQTYMKPVQLQLKEKTSVKRKKDKESAMPMQNRLEALPNTINQPLSNYAHLLMQALKSKDKALLQSILVKDEDDEVMHNTVRRISVSDVTLLISHLQQCLLNDGVKNLTIIKWIKSILYYHMSHLTSIPEKNALLEPFHAIFSAQSSSATAVAKLQSKINLVVAHVENRLKNVAQPSAEEYGDAEFSVNYRDESSDDDLKLHNMDTDKRSESEENWDDWTDEDEDEDQSDNSDCQLDNPINFKEKLNIVNNNV